MADRFVMRPSADQTWMEQIRRGEKAAWAELIARYEGRLLAFVNSRLSDRSASEDVVQETFVGFLLSLPHYDDRRDLESYLFAIAAHKLADHLRRQGRRPIGTPLSGGDNILDALPASDRRASSIVRSAEGRSQQQNVLLSALRELVETCKVRGEWERLKCIELLWVREWPNKRVAQQLHISEQTVANHKSYAISKLQKLVRQHLPAGLEIPSAKLPPLGQLWKAERVSCLSRSQIGSLLLEAVAPELADYIHFHVEVVECPFCQANLTDLQAERREPASAGQKRRSRFFQSSTGYLTQGSSETTQ